MHKNRWIFYIIVNVSYVSIIHTNCLDFLHDCFRKCTKILNISIVFNDFVQFFLELILNVN